MNDRNMANPDEVDSEMDELDMDRLDEKLGQLLNDEYGAEDFPAAQIEQRLDHSIEHRQQSLRFRVGRLTSMATSPMAKSMMAAAAALVLFVGGAEYGRRSAEAIQFDTQAALSEERLYEEGLSVPLSIQSTGSDYVAALAKLSDESDELTEAQLDEARDVTLAVLYGVVVELMRDSGEDEMLSTIAQLIHSRRQAIRNPEFEGAIWF